MHVKVLSCRHLWYFMCFIYFHIWIWGSFGLLSHCDFIYEGWLIFWAWDNYFMVVQSLTSLSFCNLHLWRGFNTRVVTVGVGNFLCTLVLSSYHTLFSTCEYFSSLHLFFWEEKNWCVSSHLPSLRLVHGLGNSVWILNYISQLLCSTN